ncbi:MAG: glycoside hydrolase family 57 protein [Bacteroidales bacterium]|jgi:alpha-amylase|nr:glycoside hydrolase family 57 protein [Bacteroidales bacterium]NLM91548.1 polysaccharide deacetylase family protein [Bacteroidales bacterium]
MKSICLFFEIHQPFRLRTYRFFDIGHKHDYFDDYANRFLMQQVAEKSYLPANALLLEMIRKHGKKFRISFSISGVALEQFELYAPEVLKSFQELAKTGCVEFLAETYGNTLASLKSPDEFKRQVKKHSEKMEELFGQKPKTFRNTEMVYSDDIGNLVYELGYRAMLTEGAKHVLGWKSPNFLYCSAVNPKLKLLLRNFQLSDDLSFRFSEQKWSEWPLTADKFLGWINNMNPNEEVVNLFLNYETFGEYQWAETGIFDFLKAFTRMVIEENKNSFKTPAEVAASLQPVSGLNTPYPISWADEERDLTAWLGNELQQEAFDKVYKLEQMLKGCNEASLMKEWERLQTSDHFFFMSTKWFSDGMVFRKINPYNSPYDAFINYMNVLSDFVIRVEQACQGRDSAAIKPEETQKAKKTAAKTRPEKSVKAVTKAAPKSKAQGK